MKVLLTGSTGFLGRVLCKQLTLHGNQVVAVSRRGHDSFCDSVSHIILGGCISSYDWTSHDFEGVDVVIHAAARAHILKDLSTDPLSEFRKVNVEATLNLARKAAEKKAFIIDMFAIGFFCVFVVSLGFGMFSLISKAGGG
jgi:nucleoside-diphosphate-sugar epimerase